MGELSKTVTDILVGYNKDLPLLKNGLLGVESSDQDQIFKKLRIFIDKFLSDINTELNNNEDSEDKIKKVVDHALRRSIRGVGSSLEMKMEENYFNLISILKLAPQLFINLDTIFNLMETELSPITNTPRDRREVKTGQLFVLSAILSSEMHNTVPTFDTKAFIEKVTSLGQESLFSKGIAFKVLRHLVLTAQENTFKDDILPFIRQELKSEQKNILSYILLLLGEERFPGICTPKLVKKLTGKGTVLNTKMIQDILDKLKEKDNVTLFAFYLQDICRHLLKPGVGVENFTLFWQTFSKIVLETKSVELMKIFFDTFSGFIENMTDVSQIELLLTEGFIKSNNKECSEKRDSCLRSLSAALENHKDQVNAKLLTSIIGKVLFMPGDFSFENTAAGKTFVRQIVLLMDKKGVKNVAALLRDVVTSHSFKEELVNGEVHQRPWQNKEKVYAIHFLNRLLKHQSVFKDQKFKATHLKFLTEIGFKTNPQPSGTSVSVELAKMVRGTLHSALTYREPSLSNFDQMFLTVAENIDSYINEGSKLRVKFTDDMKSAWKKMMKSIKTLDKIAQDPEKDKAIEKKAMVFRPLFLQLGLLLFTETSFALDCLQELEEVYHRTMNNPDYEEWTGDFVELLLSLLSRNSQLHRNLIKSIFSHLCDDLTSENIISVLRILDPRADSNPLVSKMEAKHEDNETGISSDDESGGSEEEDDESVDENDDEEDEVDDDQDEEAETVNEKLRQAIQSALMEVGNDSDNESVDVEEMDKEEGQRVDSALAKAFAQFKSITPNAEKKKQLAADKALTDFRIRVTDLLEVWLNSKSPKLDDLLDAMLTLLHLYGVCITDRKQYQLMPRVRACLKQLTSLKKLSDLEDMTEGKIAEILSLVIVQDNTSPIVYKELTTAISDCTLMLLRFGKRFHTTLSEETESSPIFTVISDAMERFFTQRNCQLQKSFFVNILNMEWICNWYLAGNLSRYAFGQNIRPFMRSQALDLLCTFFNNKRLVYNNLNQIHILKLKPITNLIYNKTTMIITEQFNLPQHFMSSLLSLIKCFEHSKISEKKNWKGLHGNLSDFNKTNTKKKLEDESENVKQKELFNFVITSGSSSDDHELNKEKPNKRSASDELSKKKIKSPSQNESTMTEEPNPILEKDKKRKKKHGKNKADKIVSKKLRLEAGSQGLIDGCFSKLRLPNDVDGDDESEDDKHEEINGVDLNGNSDLEDEPSPTKQNEEIKRKKSKDGLNPAKRKRSLV